MGQKDPKNQQKKKHLPKRVSNMKLKVRRERSWIRGQKRKAERRAAAEKAQHRNEETIEFGGMTPWQVAKAKRFARRHP